MFKKLSRHDRNHRFFSIIFATLLGRVNVVQKKFREKKKKKRYYVGGFRRKKEEKDRSDCRIKIHYDKTLIAERIIRDTMCNLGFQTGQARFEPSQ